MNCKNRITKRAERFTVYGLVVLAIVFWTFSVVPTEASHSAVHYFVRAAPGCSGFVSDIDCWASTSGGSDSIGPPGTTDTLRIDVGSGAGTAQQDIALSVASWVMTGASGITWTTNNLAISVSADMNLVYTGTFNAGSSTISVGTNFLSDIVTFNAGASAISVGNNVEIDTGTFNAQTATFSVGGGWTQQFGTFNRGTSTVVFTAQSATHNLVHMGGGGTMNLHHVTVNADTTLIYRSTPGISGRLTVNGRFQWENVTTFRRLYMDPTQSSIVNPIVLGASGRIFGPQGVNQAGEIEFAPTTANANYFELPGSVYDNVMVSFCPAASTNEDFEMRLVGDVSLGGIFFYGCASNPERRKVVSGSNDVTLTGVPSGTTGSPSPAGLVLWDAGTWDANTRAWGINATGGTWTLNGNVSMLLSSSFYISFGNSRWDFGGSSWTTVSNGENWTVGPNALLALQNVGTTSIGHASGVQVLPDLILQGGNVNFIGDMTTGGISSSGSARIITVTTGKEWTVRAFETLAGTNSAILILRSSSGGNEWRMVSLGFVAARYVNVSDSNATGGDAIRAWDGTNVDFGGNMNWAFDRPNPLPNVEPAGLLGLIAFVVIVVGGLTVVAVWARSRE